jgi:AraC-like DNA-binding protein
MVNLVEFAHALDLLDRVATPAVVDRALRAAGLNRSVVEQGSGFVPYALEAIVVEQVARTLGDADLGARLAQEFDYAVYDAYARYVLSAKDLGTALARGRQAFSLILPGAEIVLSKDDGHFLVGRRSPLIGVTGQRHLDDGAILIIDRVIRHFLGPDWRPEWVETTGDAAASTDYLEGLTGSPVRTGALMPAVAVRTCDLSTPNPSPPNARQLVGFMELPALMNVEPPKTMANAVEQILRMQFVLGDLSEDGVASRLSIGRRTLQRELKAEATSFREVKARFLERRARALLADSDLDIPTIANLLGYDEPHSFRRAFRAWTGLTPHAYRQLH